MGNCPLFRFARYSLLLAFAFLCCAMLRAQELRFFHYEVLSTEDGLPQASVHALLQSRDGYLWVGTEGGAARFDGQGFRVFDHSTSSCFTQDDVSSIAEDEAGDVWIGTSDGLIRLHGDRCTRYATQQGLPSSTILSVVHSREGMVVLTAGGAAFWQAGRFHLPAAQAELVAVAGSPAGALLLYRNGDLVEPRAGHEQTIGLRGPGGALPLGVAVGADGGLWWYDQGAVHLRAGAASKTWRVGVDVPGTRIQVLYVDAQGKAWVGTNRGLASLDAAGSAAVHVVEELRGESVLSVLRDREGDLWIGTEASGLQALQPRSFAIEPTSQQQAVSAVVRGSDGAMYLGTRADGVFRIAHGREAATTGHLTSPVVLSLAAGLHDELWVGTPDGLNEVANGDVHQWTLANGLPDNFVRSVAVAQDGTVWAGTRFGLAQLRRGDVHTYTQADGLLGDSIGALQDVRTPGGRSETLWAGTAGGVCRLQGEKFQCIRSSDKANVAVGALGTDEHGELWVALHEHGLALLDGDRLLPVASAALPREIVGILADRNGWLWLRSPRALLRVKLADAEQCAHEARKCSGLRVQRYGRAEGMQSEELASAATPVLATTGEGQLWVATRRGVAVTDPAHEEVEAVPPGLVITSARADEEEIATDGRARLSPEHRQYSVSYAGLALNNPGSVRYRYLLEGLDRNWVDAGARRTAYYTKLPSGTYVFRVQCVHGEGPWSRVASLRFTVLKPWYRRWWAYVLGACCLGLAVLGLVRGRVLAERRRLTVVLQERNRVAREVHDTLAQDLVSVSLRLELTAQHARAGRLAETTQELVQAKTLVRQALDSARQSIWDLRANLAKDSLPAQLTARVERLRAKGIVTRLRIGGEYRKASEGMESEVMGIASEALANIEKHAGATEVSVDLLYAPAALRLSVRDNGCGFETATARALAGHYGLKGLEERAALLQGRVEVASEPGHGTTVTLEAPFVGRD